MKLSFFFETSEELPRQNKLQPPPRQHSHPICTSSPKKIWLNLIDKSTETSRQHALDSVINHHDKQSKSKKKMLSWAIQFNLSFVDQLARARVYSAYEDERNEIKKSKFRSVVDDRRRVRRNREKNIKIESKVTDKENLLLLWLTYNKHTKKAHEQEIT